jgi:MFS family permease
VRGIDLGLATLALTTVALTSFAGNLLGGTLTDRVGSRRTLMFGLVLPCAGSASFAFVHTAITAVGSAIVIGLGAPISWPAQDALLATVVEPVHRSTVFSVRHATFNFGLGVGALLAAVIADFDSPGTFELLYLADAATFLVFLALLLALPGVGGPIAGEERETGGYRAVLRDRTFIGVWGLTALIVCVGYAQYLASFSVYATAQGECRPTRLRWRSARTRSPLCSSNSWC